MPELPEVETVVQQLRKKVVNKTVHKLDILEPKVIDQKISEILPFTIKDVSRRGKSIIMHLDNDYFLLTHLRMTGHFHYGNDINKKFLCGTFHFNDQSFLTHNSIRKFGSITLHNKSSLEKALSKLGPEPLADSFTAKEFIKILTKFPNANLKNKLLDQHCIVGIGNIYAQEALYYAGIHPENKIKQVSSQKLTKLHQELQRILLLSIENQGSTVDNYLNLQGEGNFQNFLAVYSKTYCPRKHKLEKIKNAGRSTSYCQKCQKK